MVNHELVNVLNGAQKCFAEKGTVCQETHYLTFEDFGPTIILAMNELVYFIMFRVFCNHDFFCQTPSYVDENWCVARQVEVVHKHEVTDRGERVVTKNESPKNVNFFEL